MMPPASEDRDVELGKVLDRAEILYDKKDSVLSSSHAHIFGKCATCNHFRFAEGEFTIIFARCEAFEKMLTQKTQIINCSNFAEKNSLTMWEMRQMAHLIDPPVEKIGFVILNEDDNGKCR